MWLDFESKSPNFRAKANSVFLLVPNNYGKRDLLLQRIDKIK